MLQRLSLRTRLNGLLGALLLLALGVNIGAMIVNAGPRVRAEADSVTRLARELVITALVSLTETSDPERALRRLMGGLGHLRHVRIYVETESDTANETTPPVIDDFDAPRWFVSLVRPSPSVTRIPAELHGHDVGTIVIASNPNDEVDEVWDGVRQLAVGGGLLAVAVFLITSYFIHLSLAPLRAASDGLADLRDGRYDLRLSPFGPPEFRRIGERLNALAERLAGLAGQNQRLVQKLIFVQDEERREIARELHDEIGPHLFAIRASASALQRQSARERGDRDAIQRGARVISEQCESLQRLNRGILGRLRPAAIAELGLGDALRALVDARRQQSPDLAISLTLPEEAPVIADAGAMAIYRMVQEALTNIARHSGATRAAVSVTIAGECLDVVIEDNGSGLPEPRPEGLGLIGMRERLAALGASLETGAAPGGGARLRSRVPLPGRREAVATVAA